MASAEEIAIERRRRGYWLRRARERKGLTLDTVAELVGYAAKSGSTVSLWESGQRPVPSDKLSSLATLLDLPTEFLLRPPVTDDERLDAAVRDAAALEREDWEAGAGRGPAADDELGDERRRRSA